MELLDGILMPVAVGFLYLLAISPVLPEIVRAPGIPTGGVYHLRVAGDSRFLWFMDSKLYLNV